MTESEKEKWMTNIVNLADCVAASVGYETVDFVLKQYGAESIEALDPGNYHAVFSDLAAIEANV